MTKFLTVSGLIYTLLFTMMEWVLSEYTGYSTFKTYNCFAVAGFISTQCLLVFLAQGMLFSLIAAIYMKPESAKIDGFRFGLITGLTVVLMALFNMLFQINNHMYEFFSSELIYIVMLMLAAYMLLGSVVGFLFSMILSKELDQKAFAYHA